MSIFTDK